LILVLNDVEQHGEGLTHEPHVGFSAVLAFCSGSAPHLLIRVPRDDPAKRRRAEVAGLASEHRDNSQHSSASVRIHTHVVCRKISEACRLVENAF
jgi:hypothetical protein